MQPSVRAKAYRCQLEGKLVWADGRKWERTDVIYAKGQFKTVLGERTLSVSCPFVATLMRAAVDPSPMVRRVAGDTLIRELVTVGEKANYLANLLAADPYPSIAERGIFALKKLEIGKET